MRIKKSSRSVSRKQLTGLVREERQRILQETSKSISPLRLSRKNGREILRENVDLAKKLYSKPTAYGGMYVEDSTGGDRLIGQMILDLIDAGDKAFFDSSDGQDPESLEKILTKHTEGVQGGANRWDADVFSDYYNVNLTKVVNRYAGLKGMDVQWMGEDDEMPSDKIWRQQNSPSIEYGETDGTNEFEEEYS